MRWQRLAIPCAVAAALAACVGKSDRGETGAVPGASMDSTSMSNPAPAASEPAMTPAVPADSSPAGTTDTSAATPK